MNFDPKKWHALGTDLKGWRVVRKDGFQFRELSNPAGGLLVFNSRDDATERAALENKSKTPTLDKMLEVHDKSQAIGEFLDWATEQGWELAEYHVHGDGCYENNDPEDGNLICGMSKRVLYGVRYGGIEKLLARYFEINLVAAEKEKRALLEELRRGQ